MVQYKHAALTLLLSTAVAASYTPTTTTRRCATPLTTFAFVTNPRRRANTITTSARSNSRRYSAIPYDDIQETNNNNGSSSLQLVDMIPNDDDEEVGALLAKKEERRVARLKSMQEASSTRKKMNYQVTLPIVRAVPPTTTNGDGTTAASSGNTEEQRLSTLVAKGQEIALQHTIGMSLRQVYSGRQLSELALDVDTLRFQSFVDELQGRRVLDDENCAVDDCSEVVNGSSGGDITDNNTLGSVQVLQNSAMEMLTDSFDGVLVSSVAKGGLAWRAGIRAGDVLTATSATMGNKLWPKSTLDGVRSAISSRKVISPMMDFEFKRLGSNEEG
eukprot:scaffold14507_cov221-Alexandrium_tamarense.AAC.1